MGLLKFVAVVAVLVAAAAAVLADCLAAAHLLVQKAADLVGTAAAPFLLVAAVTVHHLGQQAANHESVELFQARELTCPALPSLSAGWLLSAAQLWLPQMHLLPVPVKIEVDRACEFRLANDLL